MEAIRKLETQNTKLAIAFVALNIVDAVLTQVAGIKGLLYEALPVMRLSIEQSWGLFWWVKITAILICTLLLLILATKYPRQIQRIFTALVVVMTGVCIINLGGLLWV